MRYSNWFLTIVTNKKDSPELRQKFKKVIDEIFEAENGYLSGKCDHEKDSGSQCNDCDVEVEVKSAFEINEKQYPHAHLLVKTVRVK